MNWLVRRDVLDVARGGVLMGIVNVTPDSFSDGGQFRQVEAVTERVGRKWFWVHAPFYLLASRLWQCASEMVQWGMLECRPVIIT